jgi:heat shock protein HslJ
MSRVREAVLVMGVVLALSACSRESNEAAPAASGADAAPAQAMPEAPPPLDSALPTVLAGTRWQLVAFQSMDDAQGETTPDDPTKYTLSFGADGTLAVQLDCNSGSGPWSGTASADPSNGSISLGPIAATMMLCSPPSLGERLAADLPNLRGFMVRDGQLALSLMADAGIWLWAPIASDAVADAAAASTGGALENEVRAALQADLGDSLANLPAELPAPRFAFREVDLDGDGGNEVLAYLLGSIACGSGGCDMKLLRRENGALRVMQSFPITQLPVAASAPGPSGWRDLIRTESGGGAPMSVVFHTFESGQYVESSRADALPEGANEIVLGEDITYDAGLPLTE